MQPVKITNGHKTATVSKWNHLFVVMGNCGGRTKAFKTLDGAIAAANRYVK